MYDINPQYLMNGSLEDRVLAERAITESALYTLLNTTPGDQSRIFNGSVGSFWRVYLQEHITDATAARIRLEIVNSVTKWLPKVKLVLAKTDVVASFAPPVIGYYVRIVYYSPVDNSEQTVGFHLDLQ